MADKRLEYLLKLSQEKHADETRQHEARLRAAVHDGRTAARSDSQIWKRAIEDYLQTGLGAPPLNYLTEKYIGTSAPIFGSRKTLFGGTKSQLYKLPGLLRVFRFQYWAVASGVAGYRSELQEMLAGSFKVSGGAGATVSYDSYRGHIESDSGSSSTIYRTETYYTDPEVTVRW